MYITPRKSVSPTPAPGLVFFADSWDRIGFQEPIFLLAAESYRVPGTNKKPNPAALLTRVYKRLQRQVQRLQALRCVLEPVCGWVSILHCELVASELAEALQAAQPGTGEAGDLKVLALAYIPLISATRWISSCGVFQKTDGRNYDVLERMEITSAVFMTDGEI